MMTNPPTKMPSQSLLIATIQNGYTPFCINVYDYFIYLILSSNGIIIIALPRFISSNNAM